MNASPNNGASSLQMCFAAPFTFATRAGGAPQEADVDGDGNVDWYYATLPDCGAPPCVASRHKDRAGNGVIEVLAPAGAEIRRTGRSERRRGQARHAEPGHQLGSAQRAGVEARQRGQGVERHQRLVVLVLRARDRECRSQLARRTRDLATLGEGERLDAAEQGLEQADGRPVSSGRRSPSAVPSPANAAASASSASANCTSPSTPSARNRASASSSLDRAWPSCPERAASRPSWAVA